jgi:hypothetical protein
MSVVSGVSLPSSKNGRRSSQFTALRPNIKRRDEDGLIDVDACKCCNSLSLLVLRDRVRPHRMTDIGNLVLMRMLCCNGSSIVFYLS